MHGFCRNFKHYTGFVYYLFFSFQWVLSFLYVYSDHSILECYNLFSGVELSMRSFFVISHLLQIHIHHQMCNLAVIQNQYAPPNVESRPYSNSTCTTCQDLNQGPSACKLSVQTTTPTVLDTILIEQQAIILPR